MHIKAIEFLDSRPSEIHLIEHTRILFSNEPMRGLKKNPKIRKRIKKRLKQGYK